jgi:hypothetical protein
LNSAFYKQLGGASVVKIIREYMAEVQSYSFKKTPDYEKLASILSKLNVPITKTTTKSTPKRKAPPKTKTPSTKTTGTKRRTRSSLGNAEDDDEGGQKHARAASPMDYEVVELGSSDEDDGVQEMDVDESWEVISDENKESLNTTSTKASSSKPTIGVTVTINEGPHRGKTFTLVQDGGPNAAILGRAPATKKGEMLVTLDQDEDLDDSHVRLELNVSGKKQLLSLDVVDLKSTNGTFVGRDRTSKSRIFMSQAIQIGNSSMSFKQYTGPPPGATSAKKARRGSRTTRPASPMEMDVEESVPVAAAVSNQNRNGIRVDVIEGPHAGESFDLVSGLVESLVFGSKPSASRNVAAKLVKDKALGGSHIRVELVEEGNKKQRFYSVNVCDLKAGATLVNTTTLGKGKTTRAFVNDRITVGNTVLQVKKL